MILNLILVVCLMAGAYGSEEEIHAMTEETLAHTLDAIEKGLDYLMQEYENINLDGVIGTRLVEGIVNGFMFVYVYVCHVLLTCRFWYSFEKNLIYQT